MEPTEDLDGAGAMEDRCRVCGCTDAVPCPAHAGAPGSWVEPGLCSGCVGDPRAAGMTAGRVLRGVAGSPNGLEVRHLAHLPHAKRVVRKLKAIGLIRTLDDQAAGGERLWVTADGRAALGVPW